MTASDRNQSRRVPFFTSVEEEAAFWDTQSVLDYLDDLGPPQFVSKKTQTQGITVRFEPEALT